MSNPNNVVNLAEYRAKRLSPAQKFETEVREALLPFGWHLKSLTSGVAGEPFWLVTFFEAETKNLRSRQISLGRKCGYHSPQALSCIVAALQAELCPPPKAS